MQFNELVVKVSKSSGLSLKKSEAVVKKVFTSISTEVLVDRRRLIVPKFGTFFPKTRPARKVVVSGREVQLGNEVQLKFRPGKHARKAV